MAIRAFNDVANGFWCRCLWLAENRANVCVCDGAAYGDTVTFYYEGRMIEVDVKGIPVSSHTKARRLNVFDVLMLFSFSFF